MCFDFQPLYPPTEKAKVLNNQLFIICYCEIAFAILRFAATDFIGGIIQLFLCLILWCGVKQMQFCQLLMYIIICMIFWLMSFIQIGAQIQHNEFWKLNSYTDVAQFVVQCIALIFYIVAISFAFQGYKEYKAIQYQSIGGGVISMFRQQQQGRQGRDDGGSNNQNNGGGRQQYAQQGQYQPPPYQEGNQNQNQNSNASGNSGAGGGGFQAFQGRGVRLG